MRCHSLFLAAFVLLSAPSAAGVHSRTSSASPQTCRAAGEAAYRAGLGPAAGARARATAEIRTQRRGFLQECARGTRLLTLRGGGEDSEELDGMNGYASTDPVVQFGKGGHIEQIEFAMRAVQKGLTVIAVKGEHVCVILVERRALPLLQVASSARKIYQIDAHIIGTIAGMSADARPLVDRAQVECLNHRLEYEDCPSVRYVAKFLGDVMLQATLSGDSRPFGCSMILSGFDLLSEDMSKKTVHLDTRLPEVESKNYPVPRIFLVDPSGSFREWKTVAMGKNSQEINQYLEKNYVQNMESIEGMDIQTEERFLCEFALGALMEFSLVTKSSVEFATQTADGGTRIVQDEEVQIFIDNLERQAAIDREKAVAAGIIKSTAEVGAFRREEVSEPSTDSFAGLSE